jgi:general secretion pathway protein G
MKRKKSVQCLNFFSKLHHPKFPRGFTLIELLVVIAIIGVLTVASITILNPLTQMQKAQDSRRKSDLSQIQKAIEVYYNERGYYPNTLTFGSALETYMKKVPNDPNPSKTYGYSIGLNGQAYYLYASLDRGSSDSQACNGGSACASAPSGACGAEAVCNYGVSSPNVSVAEVIPTIGEIPTATPTFAIPSPTPTPTSTPAPTFTPTPTNTPTPTPTPVMLTLKSTFPGYLWAGSLMDTATKGTQTWGAQNTVLQPLTLNPVTTKDVIIEYQLLDPWFSSIESPVYLASMPDVSGNITWDGSAHKFVGGGTSTNLLTSSNKQNIVGTVVGQDWYNNMVTVTITESKSISGYLNVGQYYIGQTVTFYYPPPVSLSGSVLSGAVEVFGAVFYSHGISIPVAPWVIYLPGWRCDSMRNKRTMPDSAYSFSTNITYESGTPSYVPVGPGITLSFTPTTKIKFNSVTGSVPSFRIMIAASGSVAVPIMGGGYLSIPMTNLIQQLAGPISNFTLNITSSILNAATSLGSSAYDFPPFQIWAHPDQSVPFSSIPSIDNWQLLMTIPSIRVGT